MFSEAISSIWSCCRRSSRPTDWKIWGSRSARRASKKSVVESRVVVVEIIAWGLSRWWVGRHRDSHEPSPQPPLVITTICRPVSTTRHKPWNLWLYSRPGPKEKARRGCRRARRRIESPDRLHAGFGVLSVLEHVPDVGRGSEVALRVKAELADD